MWKVRPGATKTEEDLRVPLRIPLFKIPVPHKLRENVARPPSTLECLTNPFLDPLYWLSAYTTHSRVLNGRGTRAPSSCVIDSSLESDQAWLGHRDFYPTQEPPPSAAPRPASIVLAFEIASLRIVAEAGDPRQEMTLVKFSSLFSKNNVRDLRRPDLSIFRTGALLTHSQWGTTGIAYSHEKRCRGYYHHL